MKKIGFSLSRCVADIADGNVSLDDVVLILSRTRITEWDQMREIITAYQERGEWAKYTYSLLDKILEHIWNRGKLFQFRCEAGFGEDYHDSLSTLRRTLIQGAFTKTWIDIVPSGDLSIPAVADAWNQYRVVAGLHE